jgi:hypothetical protein
MAAGRRRTDGDPPRLRASFRNAPGCRTTADAPEHERIAAAGFAANRWEPTPVPPVGSVRAICLPRRRHDGHHDHDVLHRAPLTFTADSVEPFTRHRRTARPHDGTW